MLLTPNPPSPDHWLVKEFPEDNHIAGHRYICTSVYDNAHIIGRDYINQLEQDYPKGHVLRRRFIEGKRGLSIVGDPVYKNVFSRGLHVQEIEFLPDFPLVESWDFGQKHPAVSWHQFTPWGWWNVLGCYQGDQQFIDETVPIVAAVRNELFPDLQHIRVCCDPAGADKQGHGIRTTAVDVLNQHLRLVYGAAVGAQFISGSNRPEKREWCIQQTSGYMSRIVRGRPAFAIHARCEILIDGFEAGYVYDDRTFINAALPNLRRVKKDGFYDHLQNTSEYALLNFGNRYFDAPLPSSARTLQQQQADDEDVEAFPARTNRSGY